VCVCVCISLSYPACNAHEPYCHLWPNPLWNIFPHYLINGTVFGGWGVRGIVEHKIYFDFHFSFQDWFSEILSEKFTGLHLTYLLFWSELNERVSKHFQTPNFMKILPVGQESSHVEGRSIGRTDEQRYMTKPTVAFRNFGNAPKRFDGRSNISDTQTKFMHV
jgi:hypothetical protein